ncbi:MAG: hypothetical protein [Bacteriophage sp.]|nr:MAG: hypothetical protein [Bacteriophage sp.]
MSIELIQKQLEEARKEVKESQDALRAELEKTGKLNTEHSVTLGKMEGRIFDLEKQLAESGGLDNPDTKNNSEAQEVAKALMSGYNGQTSKAPIDLKKAITSDTTSAGSLVTPQYVPGIITPGQRRFMIRDLLASGTTGSNTIEYMRENLFTNAAAPVAETVLKPESTLTFSAETATVRTIAHWLTASRQIMDDAAMLQSYIGNRLMYGLKLVEENQMLNGDGTGQNLEGINVVATPYDTDLNADVANLADQIAMGIYQVSLSEYPASGIVLNTLDWFRMCLLKDTNGNYILGGPQAFASQVLWGLPVVATTAQAKGTFTLGAFDLASQVWDRQQASVEITPYNADNFVKNMLTILVEERLALAHYRPAALVTGTLIGNSGS